AESAEESKVLCALGVRCGSKCGGAFQKTSTGGPWTSGCWAIMNHVSCRRLSAASLRFGQQFVDLCGDLLVAVVAEFALPAVTHHPVLVHQVDGRPVLVAPRLPVGPVIVHGDGERELVLGHPVLDPVHVLLGVELRRMNADHEEALVVLVLVLPGPVV